MKCSKFEHRYYRYTCSSTKNYVPVCKLGTSALVVSGCNPYDVDLRSHGMNVINFKGCFIREAYW